MNPSGNPIGYLAAFIGGLLVSLTPCVYPLIPAILGLTGAGSSDSRLRGFILSLAYSFGLAFTYSLLGMIAVLTGRLFGSVSSHPFSYILVGNVCIFFGLYMFEVFNLPLPSLPLGNKIKGRRLFSIFILGAASGFVVGPCTTPVLGSILAYAATRQSIFYGATLLFVFALGMCAFLILVGTFSGLVLSLPKPGRWLNVIKKAFAVVLILAGEYFLIMAGRLLW